MTHEQLIKEGWIQTDGSCSTLQYAKKVNDTTWLYRQWLDIRIIDIEVSPMRQWTESFSCEHKLENWDSSKWTEDEVDISVFSLDYIRDSISTFGYSIVSVRRDRGQIRELIITDKTHEYSIEDSIQLVCECIFELEN